MGPFPPTVWQGGCPVPLNAGGDTSECCWKVLGLDKVNSPSEKSIPLDRTLRNMELSASLIFGAHHLYPSWCNTDVQAGCSRSIMLLLQILSLILSWSTSLLVSGLEN